MTIATIIPSFTNNPPSRANPAAFPTDGDSFLNDLAGIVSAQNAVASELTAWNSEIETFKNQSAASKTNAESSKNNALTQARNAAASQVSLWVSGTTYAVNQIVYSSVDGRQYKRILAGAGTTDPSSDPTNWEPLGWEYITNYPDIRPTLDLNFAGSQAVDPRITFTRNSIATYFDKFGVMQTAGVNQPRIDFDPVTGECKGLLIEEQRTNLLTYSEQFDNAAWVKDTATVIPNSAVSPSGTLSMCTLVESAGLPTNAAYGHSIRSGTAIATGTTFAVSVFVKAKELTQIAIGIQNQSVSSYRIFDISTLSIVANAGSSPTGAVFTLLGVEHCGNGIYRVKFSVVENFSVGGANFLKLATARNGSINYTGDGTSGIYIWGAQLEAGAFPTSYIPTTTAQVTRAADSAVMTGTNFSSWYRQDEGAFVSEAAPSSMSAVNMCVVAATDGTDGNIIGCFADVGYGLYVQKGGVEMVAIAGGAYSAGAFSKNASSYSLNAFATCLNSGTVAVDSSGLVPTLSQLWIGRYTGNYRLNGHIKRITYYPKRLPNQVLQAITQP